MTDLDDLEREAAAVLWKWLRAQPMVDEEGNPLLSDNGKPAAVEVLTVINALRVSEQLKQTP